MRPVTVSRALVTVLGTALLAVTGCTADNTVAGTPVADSAPPPAEGPGSDPAVWAGNLCAAVLRFAEPAAAAPDFATATDLPAVRQQVSTYLSAVITGAQQGREQLTTIGRAPEPGGDDLVGRTTTELAMVEQDLGAARTTVDQANTRDSEAFLNTLGQVETTLSRVSASDPVAALATAPRLQGAARNTEQCKRLADVTSTLPK